MAQSIFDLWFSRFDETPTMTHNRSKKNRHQPESSNNVHGSIWSSGNEPMWIRIADSEEPTAAYSHCPIWNASSYADAEAKAMELVKQDVHYVAAMERAKHRQMPSKQYDSVQLNEMKVTQQAHEILLSIERRMVEHDAQPPTDDSSTCHGQFSMDIADQQLTTEDIDESKSISLSREEIDLQLTENESTTCCGQFSMDIADQQLTTEDTDEPKSIPLSQQEADLPSTKTELTTDQTNSVHDFIVTKIGIQENSLLYLSTKTADLELKPTTFAYSSQSMEMVLPSTKRSKRSHGWLFKCCRQIRKRVFFSKTYSFDKQRKFWSKLSVNTRLTNTTAKSIISILSMFLVIYLLSIDSLRDEKGVKLLPIANIHMISSGLPILSAVIIIFSSCTSSYSRSPSTLWSYTFAVP